MNLLDGSDASAGHLPTWRTLAAGFIPFVMCQSNYTNTFRTPLLQFNEGEEKQFCQNRMWEIQKKEKKNKKKKGKFVNFLDVSDASAGHLPTCWTLAAGFIPFVMCQSNYTSTFRTILFIYKIWQRVEMFFTKLTF